MALFSYQPPAYGADADMRAQVRELYRQNRLLSEQLTYMFAAIDEDNMAPGARKLLHAAQGASRDISGLRSGLGALATKKALELLSGTVDGKVTTYYHDEAPAGANLGDLWFDTATGKRLYRWNGTKWQQVDDERIVEALSAAGDARATADGKIVSFVQEAEPAGVAAGDLWINTSDNNALNRWDGDSWSLVRDDHMEAYIRKTAEGIVVGKENAAYSAELTPTGLVFYENGSTFLGEFANGRLLTNRASVRDRLTMGSAGTGYYDVEMSYRRMTVKFREG